MWGLDVFYLSLSRSEQHWSCTTRENRGVICDRDLTVSDMTIKLPKVLYPHIANYSQRDIHFRRHKKKEPRRIKKPIGDGSTLPKNQRSKSRCA